MSEHTGTSQTHGHPEGHNPAAHAGNGDAPAPEHGNHKMSVVSPLSTNKEWKFSFKKQTVQDDLGMEKKRPPVTVTIPVPTVDGLLTAFDNPKVVTFVLDLVEEAIKDQVRAQLSDDNKPAMRQEELDMEKLSLQFIAEMPKSERTGGGIPKESWEEWEKDFVGVMVQVRSADPKAPEKVGKAAKLMVGRLNGVRTDKAVLTFLREQLALWASNTTQLEDHGDIYTYLDNRATELLKRENTSQLENLS